MQGVRLCPRCGAADPIQVRQEVWPPGWSCRSCGHAVPMSNGIPMYAPSLADTQSGFEPAYFAMLAEVEREHFWFVPRNRLITMLMARFFPNAIRFLEVGCGTGTVLSAIAALRDWQSVVGSELHPSGLVEARRRLGSRARFVQMDARAIPARDAFDVAGAFDVIEHIAEDEQVLAAMYGAIAPGGGAVLAVPQHPSLWSDMDNRSHHVRRYRRGELERKLTSAGFDVVFSGSYTVVLFPLMAMSRLLRRSTGYDRHVAPRSEPVPLGTEYHLPKALNAFAKALLQTEVSMTLAGIRFPFGGSRVVVAMKR